MSNGIVQHEIHDSMPVNGHRAGSAPSRPYALSHAGKARRAAAPRWIFVVLGLVGAGLAIGRLLLFGVVGR